MKPKYNEITVLDIQIIASALSILTILSSIILLYNQELLIQKKKPIFQKELALKLSALNRIIILLIVLTFILANFLNIELDKEKPDELKYDYIEIFASILTLTVSLISIYVAIKALDENNLNLDTISDEAII